MNNLIINYGRFLLTLSSAIGLIISIIVCFEHFIAGIICFNIVTFATFGLFLALDIRDNLAKIAYKIDPVSNEAITPEINKDFLSSLREFMGLEKNEAE